MRKHIEGETGDYMLIEKEEKTGRSLTYDDSRRLLILALLIVLGIFAVYTLKHVLLLVAVVFIVGMVFNPVIAWLERRGIAAWFGAPGACFDCFCRGGIDRLATVAALCRPSAAADPAGT